MRPCWPLTVPNLLSSLYWQQPAGPREGLLAPTHSSHIPLEISRRGASTRPVVPLLSHHPTPTQSPDLLALPLHGCLVFLTYCSGLPPLSSLDSVTAPAPGRGPPRLTHPSGHARPLCRTPQLPHPGPPRVVPATSPPRHFCSIPSLCGLPSLACSGPSQQAWGTHPSSGAPMRPQGHLSAGVSTQLSLQVCPPRPVALRAS